MSDGVYSERKNAVANDTQSAKKKNPKLKPSEVGSIWRRRSDGVNERWRLFGTKKRRRERYEVREKEKPQIEAQRSGFNLEKEERRSE